MNLNTVKKIIDALSIHQDSDSIRVLNEVGTNSSIDDVREMTSRALVKKNVRDSLELVISNEGKGINDLSTVVAMSTINELLALDNKDEAISILENTVNTHENEDVRDNARSVKALMALSF